MYLLLLSSVTMPILDHFNDVITRNYCVISLIEVYTKTIRLIPNK